MLGEFAEAVPDIDVAQETEGEISPDVSDVADALTEEAPQSKSRGLMARG